MSGINEGEVQGSSSMFYGFNEDSVYLPLHPLSNQAPNESAAIRICSVVSRSRTVTVPSSIVSPSIVTQKGVPASSWRRYLRPIAPDSS